MSRPDEAPDPRSPRDILIANGRVKYSATFINGIAVAVFAVGGVAPFASLAADPRGHGLSWLLFGIGAVCWIGSFALPWVVLRRLGRLAV